MAAELENGARSSGRVVLPDVVSSTSVHFPLHQVFVEAKVQAWVRHPGSDSVGPVRRNPRLKPELAVICPWHLEGTGGSRTLTRELRWLLCSAALCWRQARRSCLMPRATSSGHQPLNSLGPAIAAFLTLCPDADSGMAETLAGVGPGKLGVHGGQV